LQDHPEEIGQAVEKMLRYLMLATVPTLAVTAALIPWIIEFVFTNKWRPATVAFYLLTLRMLGGNITTPFVGVLNAMGRVTTSLRILGWWTVADWGLALALTRLWGFNGVAAAYALGVIVPVVWLLREARAVAPINLKYAVGHPLAAGVITGALTWLMGRGWITDLFSLAAVAVLGLALYLLTMVMIERGRFVREIQKEARLVKNVVVSKLEESG
jgi:O-antigen/teichoic acid export membrane protein